MPIFQRSDGTVVKDLTVTRRILPYLMVGRNEAIVYYEMLIDLTETLEFIDKYNAEQTRKLTLWHLVVAAAGRVLHERPGLNRFVSGGRIYQRNSVQLSFAVKKQFKDYAPLVGVKYTVEPTETLEQTIDGLEAAIGTSRSDTPVASDREAKGFLMLPGFLLRLVIWLGKKLDAANLLPRAMWKNDPMYASAFLANPGSVGVDRVWHHLYEWGNVSIFGVLGQVGDVLFVEEGKPVAKKGVRLRFSFDERINDGHYCAKAIQLVQRYLEAPAQLIDRGDVDHVIAADAEAAREAFVAEKATYTHKPAP